MSIKHFAAPQAHAHHSLVTKFPGPGFNSACEFNFGDKGFAQMGAVVEDHGIWDDAAQYFESQQYARFNAIQRLFYPMLAAISNSKIEKLRASVA